jgi:hypothetical protein
MNDLVGVLPQELKVFSSLEILDVHSNQLFGTIPNVVEHVNLKILDVEDNALVGPAMVPLDGLDQLVSYRVSFNQLSGTIDTSILESVSSLTELWMAGNVISGSIPQSIGALTSLGESVEAECVNNPYLYTSCGNAVLFSNLFAFCVWPLACLPFQTSTHNRNTVSVQ